MMGLTGFGPGPRPIDYIKGDKLKNPRLSLTKNSWSFLRKRLDWPGIGEQPVFRAERKQG